MLDYEALGARPRKRHHPTVSRRLARRSSTSSNPSPRPSAVRSVSAYISTLARLPARISTSTAPSPAKTRHAKTSSSSASTIPRTSSPAISAARPPIARARSHRNTRYRARYPKSPGSHSVSPTHGKHAHAVHIRSVARHAYARSRAPYDDRWLGAMAIDLPRARRRASRHRVASRRRVAIRRRARTRARGGARAVATSRVDRRREVRRARATVAPSIDGGRSIDRETGDAARHTDEANLAIESPRDACLAPRRRIATHTRTPTNEMSLVAARAIRITAAKAPAPSKRAATRATAVKARVADVVDRVKLPAMTLAAQIACAVPAAHAEAGKLFDFDLTLPIIATEFLLLMTILDKTVFGPVGKALDDRDELIRSQLAAVGGNSAEVEALIVRLSDATRARERETRARSFFLCGTRRGGDRRESRARAARIADGEMGRLGFIQTGARGARTERRRESASD